jgi:hypothetical protein
MDKTKKQKIKKCKYNDCQNYYWDAKKFCSQECKAMFQFFKKLNLIFSILLTVLSLKHKHDYLKILKIAVVQSEYKDASPFIKNILYYLRQDDFIDLVWISHISIGNEKNTSGFGPSPGSDPWSIPESNGKQEWEHLFSLLSKDDIKALKLALSKRYHPDMYKDKDKDKENIMKQLNNIFDTLLK